MSLEFSEGLDTPITTPTYVPQDAAAIGLRPKLLADYTGQEKAKGNLAVYIEAARMRNESLARCQICGINDTYIIKFHSCDGRILVTGRKTGSNVDMDDAIIIICIFCKLLLVYHYTSGGR